MPGVYARSVDNYFQVTKVLVRNLNKIIDVNWYPVEEAQKSNVRHRPMGIGVQGLADTFIKVSSSATLVSRAVWRSRCLRPRHQNNSKVSSQ